MSRKNKNRKNKKRNIILSAFIFITICLIVIVIYGTTSKAAKKVEQTIEYVENDNVIYVTLEADGTMVEDTNEVQEEKKDENKNENEKKTNNTATYYVKVNNSANVVTVYSKDENGEYTVPVKAMICSTGSSTPKSGKYTVPGRRSRWRALYGNVYGQWVTNIVGAILFHSVPYLENDNPGSLEYWEYDKLGTSASMGCVRLKASDAQWIYYNIPSGTTVEFYSDSNPGPLGKPSAQKISGNAECRNWDPTDNTQGNPWFNQNKEEPAKEEKQEDTKPVENKEINENNSNIENQASNVSNANETDSKLDVNEQLNNTTENIQDSNEKSNDNNEEKLIENIDE